MTPIALLRLLLLSLVPMLARANGNWSGVHADSLDLLAQSLARPEYTERASVRNRVLSWPGLEIRLVAGTVERSRCGGPGVDIWLLRFKGKARVLTQPADSLEARLLAEAEGPELDSKWLRSFLLIGSELPPALSDLAWRPRPGGWMSRLKSSLGNDDSAALARVPWPGLIADLVTSAQDHRPLSWLLLRRPRLLVRCAGSDPDATTTVLRPLLLGSSLFRPLAELARTGPVGFAAQTPWSPLADDPFLCDSLRMELEILPDLQARWKATFHGRLERPGRLITLRLDPAAKVDSLLGPQGNLSLWRPRTRGLDAPGSPVIHLLAAEPLAADTPIRFELWGQGSLELATRISGNELVWPLRAWHPQPARRDRRPGRVHLQLLNRGPLDLGLAGGTVVAAAGVEPSTGEFLLEHPGLPVLHALPRRHLPAGDSIQVYLPDANSQRLALPRETGTSLWSYRKETLLDSQRPWRPRNPATDLASDDPLPEAAPVPPLPETPADPLLENLAPLQQALQTLLFPLPAPPVLLGEWQRTGDPGVASKDWIYAPAANEQAGRLPVSALLGGDEGAILLQARALAAQWWGGRVALAEQGPDWLLEGLRIATALLVIEDVRGSESSIKLKEMAHARLDRYRRQAVDADLALPVLGPRAAASWQDPETAEALAWRFALLLENLRHASRDPRSLADTRYRRLLRDLCYSLQGGALDGPALGEKLGQHLGPWAAARFGQFAHRPGPIPLRARVQADGDRLHVHVTGHEPGLDLTVPLLLRFTEGPQALYFLELTDRDQHFVIDPSPDSTAGFRLDPWHSLDLEVIE
jgi:hypothetical protein